MLIKELIEFSAGIIPDRLDLKDSKLLILTSCPTDDSWLT